MEARLLRAGVYWHKHRNNKMLSDEETLYLYKIHRLRELAYEEHWQFFKMLDAAAILRHLLFDHPALLDQANREERQKIAFTVGSYIKDPPDSPLSFVMTGLSFDPHRSRASSTESFIRDRFHEVPLIRINRVNYSIKDLVLAAANMFGGVHTKSPTDDKQARLLQVGFVDHREAVAESLVGIGRVVFTGLQPLTQALIARDRNRGGP